VTRQRQPRRPDPQPLETDDVRIVAVGTALWTVALLVLLPFYPRLAEEGRGWWVWTCVAGAGLGLLGVQYCRHRRDALARSRRRREEEARLRPREPLT
jgi:Protein of unknown function (DUF2530)